MSNISDFTKEFLDRYLAGGFGSLGKRDIDVLVMHLLDTYGDQDGKPLRSLSNQEASLRLRTPLSRVRSLRYEATLKYVADNEGLAKTKLLEVLARSQLDQEKGRIGLVIEDSFTRNWLQARLKQHGVLFDSSFNTEIVRVQGNQLCDALASVFEAGSVEKLRARFKELESNESKVNFAEAKKEFLKGAAGEIGGALVGVTLKGLLAMVT